MGLQIESMGDIVVVLCALVDDSAWPVVVLIEYGELADEERVKVTQTLRALMAQRGPFALVLDLTQAEPVPQTQRTYLKSVMTEDDGLFAESLRAVAVVVGQPVVMHMALAAFWMKLAPSRMFVDVEEAATWARGMASLKATGAIPIVRDEVVHPQPHCSRADRRWFASALAISRLRARESALSVRQRMSLARARLKQKG